MEHQNPILQNKYIVKIIEWSKTFVLPGFSGVPLYEVTIFFIKSMAGGTLTTRGAAIAFSFFMALFPSIIFLFTLIPYIPVDNFQEILLAQLETVLPEEAYTLSKETILDIVNRPRGGLLSVGFISALFFSTNGINALIDAFNQSNLVTITRPWWKQRLVALLLVIIITTLTLIAVIAIITNEMVMNYLVENDILTGSFNILIVQFIEWIIIVALFYFTISFIYAFGPAERKQWKFFSAGSTFTTFLIILSSLGFSYYINNFGQYNKLYGSIGTLLVIMLWLNLISTFLIIGFELNASITSAKMKNKELKDLN